jgi:hypothetical protein
MESSNKFACAFLKLIAEDITAASALGSSEGGFNPEAGVINSTDFYAKGDARIATPPSVVQTRKGAIKRRRSKKKKNKK